MSALHEVAVDRLLRAREDLLKFHRAELTGEMLYAWVESNKQTFKQSESICRTLIFYDAKYNYLQGFENETDTEVLVDIRDRILGLIDKAVNEIDAKREIKPIVDVLILRVQNPKLQKLLNEFNSVRATQPNLAGIGFRTILGLIIQERARIVDAGSKIATNDDFGGFEQAIKYALSNNELFSSAAQKHLRTYLNGTMKDALDNVAHKSNYLIETDDLATAISLLGQLLPALSMDTNSIDLSQPVSPPSQPPAETSER